MALLLHFIKISTLLSRVLMEQPPSTASVVKI